MDNKKYIVVTNAIRETLSSWNNCFSAGAGKTCIDYRRGHFGLIHPDIVEFYSDYKENMKKSKSEDDLLTPIASWIPICSAGTGVFPNEKYDTIPILVHEKHEAKKESANYRIILLQEKEFEEVRGTDLDAVVRGIKKINKKIWNNKNYLLRKQIKEQWMYLEAFDIFMQDKIPQIPFEAAMMHIDEEVIKNKSDLQKTLRELQIWRANSMASAERMVVG